MIVFDLDLVRRLGHDPSTSWCKEQGIGDGHQWPEVKGSIPASKEPNGLQTAQGRAKRRPGFVHSFWNKPCRGDISAYYKSCYAPSGLVSWVMPATQGVALGCLITALQAEEPELRALT